MRPTSSAESHEGGVRQARMHGYGRYYDKHGNLQYEGQYVDNQPVE